MDFVRHKKARVESSCPTRRSDGPTDIIQPIECRAQAQRRFPEFQYPIPEGIDVSVIPTTALLPLA